MQETPNQTTGDQFPSALLARVVRADATITYNEMSGIGDIRFSIPMRATKLSRVAMQRHPVCRTAFFADLIGELLVRKNLPVFVDVLKKLDATVYDSTVSKHKHRHFGLIIDEDDVLHFEFHISLVQHILTEDLNALLGI